MSANGSCSATRGREAPARTGGQQHRAARRRAASSSRSTSRGQHDAGAWRRSRRPRGAAPRRGTCSSAAPPPRPPATSRATRSGTRGSSAGSTRPAAPAPGPRHAGSRRTGRPARRSGRSRSRCRRAGARPGRHDRRPPAGASVAMFTGPPRPRYRLLRPRPAPGPCPPGRPALTFSSASTPSTGATTVCSIFIASSTTSGCPAVTAAPASASTRTTPPGIGASSDPAAVCGVRVGEPRHLGQRHGTARSVHVGHPGRPLHGVAPAHPADLQHDGVGRRRHQRGVEVRAVDRRSERPHPVADVELLLSPAVGDAAGAARPRCGTPTGSWPAPSRPPGCAPGRRAPPPPRTGAGSGAAPSSTGSWRVR